MIAGMLLDAELPLFPRRCVARWRSRLMLYGLAGTLDTVGVAAQGWP